MGKKSLFFIKNISSIQIFGLYFPEKKLFVNVSV